MLIFIKMLLQKSGTCLQRLYFSLLPIVGLILLLSLLLVVTTVAVVAVVRRKMSSVARHSPSSQLELINNQKQELDYSPDIIPRSSGKKILNIYQHSVVLSE